MQDVVVSIIALGSTLVVVWLCLVFLVFRAVKPGREWYYDADWQKMVLGFFARCSTPLLLLWWLTATVSAVGWVIALFGVSETLDTHPTSESGMGMMYMRMCIAQLCILLVWTILVVAVHPTSSTIWRWANVIVLLAVSCVYIATAVFFFLVEGLSMSPEYRMFVGLCLCVHAVHGLVWDTVVWGWSYIVYRSDYEQATRK